MVKDCRSKKAGRPPVCPSQADTKPSKEKVTVKGAARDIRTMIAGFNEAEQEALFAELTNLAVKEDANEPKEDF